MNLDDMKNSWQQYDQRLLKQSLLHEKLIRSIMKEKSHSILERMRREYLFTFLYLLVFTTFCVLSILYNAFDYTQLVHYIPLSLYTLAALFILVMLGKGFNITRMEIDKENLFGSIQKVLYLHKEYVSRTGKAKLVFVLAGFLFPFTFFSRIYADKGLWSAAGLVLMTIFVIAGLLLAFRKFGVFKDRYGEKLEQALQELAEFEEPGMDLKS